MKKYRIVFPLLLSCILWYSCTDWLDYKPSDKQSEEQQFSSKDGFYAAVNGVYNRMSGNSLYGKYLSYDMIDILGQYYAVEQSDESDYYKYLRALTEWDYSNESVTGVLSSIWNEAYSTIMNTNVVLKNIEDDAVKDKVLPEREYKMLKGEMLAVRAMLHLDMLRLFGPIMAKNPDGRGIPYNESTDPQILSIMPAGTVLKDYIIRDLTEAEALLLASDPVLTEGPRAEYDEVSQDNSMRYRQLRLNYYATVLLTARADLWWGDYGNALTEARKLTDDPQVRKFFPVVESGKLLGNSSDPDRMFSTECLFGYYNKNRGLIYDYSFGGGNTGKALLIPRTGYVDGILFYKYGGYWVGDWRFQSQWASGTTLEGNASYQMVKFKEIADQKRDEVTNNKDENQLLQAQKFYGTFCSLIKLSEAYYIAAECLGTTGSEVYDLPTAWTYLNRMFVDRGTNNWGTGNGESFLQDWLTLEYIREFVGEGQKFFYFKRRNMGFDNDYNGRKEVKVMTNPGIPMFGIPPTYDYKDKATDEEKEERFVLPLPKSELDNR